MDTDLSFPVLVARIRDLLRRSSGREPGSTTVGSIRIDSNGRRVWPSEVEVELTRREFDVFEFLARRTGNVVSKDEILSGVWGFDFVGDSCASLLSDEGVPNEAIADLLGHTTTRMADQTYGIASARESAWQGVRNSWMAVPKPEAGPSASYAHGSSGGSLCAPGTLGTVHVTRRAATSSLEENEMSRNLKLSLGLVVAAIVAMLATAAVTGRDDSGGDAAPGEEVAVVRADSWYLSEGSSDAVFVEFLDFECEACRAAFPAIEELRATYGDEVTFVVRNFPLHHNSVAATRAAEAASAQGAFEEMYVKLFETQPEWGERTDSQEDVFFGFAEDLGLDMGAFREVYDDPATVDKIERDQADGRALGVSGTPTFFLDGEKLDPGSYEDLIERIEQAIDG